MQTPASLPARPWLLVLVLAAGMRLCVLHSLADGPCLDLHRWDQSDMAYFDAWARTIAGGDLASRSVRPPLHSWLLAIAQEHLRQHPAERAAVEARVAQVPGPQDPVLASSAAVLDGWFGGGRFYQEPLYAYLLAAVYRVAGPHPFPVILLQALLGILNALLVFALAKRAFGPAVGAVAGVLAALYAPSAYLEAVLVRETLLVTAGLGLCLLGAESFKRDRLPFYAAVGATLGAALLLKSHFALLGLGLAAVPLVRRRGRGRLAGLSALVAGLALALAPLVARNLVVGVPALSLTSAGGLNAAWALARPDRSPIAETAAALAEGEGRLGGTLLAALRRHTPGSLTGLLADRLSAAWSPYEAPDNTNFSYFRLHAPPLRPPMPDFTLVGPLGLVGLFLARRRSLDSPALFALAGLCATSFAMLLAFFVRDRFRLPFAVALLPFAALTLVEAARGLRRPRDLALVALPVAVAAGVFHLRPSPANPVRPADHAAAWLASYLPDAREAMDQGRAGDAAALLLRSLQTAPRSLVEGGELAADDRALAGLFSGVYLELARALAASGDAAGAAQAEGHAARLSQAAGGVP